MSKRAFTLIESLVTLAVVLVGLSLAMPAANSIALSSERRKTIATFGVLCATAQTTAQRYFTPAALRIERAFKVDDNGQMITDANGQPVWRNHQQVRLLVFGNRQPGFEIPGEEMAFRQVVHSRVTALPASYWLAPDYARSDDFDPNLIWQPGDPDVSSVNTLDTFYMVWDRRGHLIQAPASQMLYLDQTQGNSFVAHPYPSARSAIGYQRLLFEQSGQSLDVVDQGLDLYVNRYTAGVVVGSEE